MGIESKLTQEAMLLLLLLDLRAATVAMLDPRRFKPRLLDLRAPTVAMASLDLLIPSITRKNLLLRVVLALPVDATTSGFAALSATKCWSG